MKSLLHLNMSQQARLTPQRQLAIRLLQMSTLDLKQEIQNQVETNPMLEECASEPLDDEFLSATEQDDEELSDFQWSHLYNTQKPRHYFNEDFLVEENLYSTPFNLQDYLRWQLELTPMTDIDFMIGTAVIDAINENGFLTLSVHELFEALIRNTEGRLTMDDIEVVRHRIQHFDPLGCGAINLVEALLFQLNQLPQETPYVALSKKIISESIECLGKHHYRYLMKKYHVDEQVLDKVVFLIQTLKPNPGVMINQSKPEFIIPDLMVKKTTKGWLVELSPMVLPRLEINRYYASLISQTKSNSDHRFLKTNLQEARWFLKSIENRQNTLLRVARCIVDHQKRFFEFGDEAMKPLLLNDVADDLGLHESTISRVTTQKFMDTPRGLFELKYFFSSPIPTSMEGECSSIAIRAVIKKLIAVESPRHPFSDQAIAKLMKEKGVNIARRTVSKYREMMKIAPSFARKLIVNNIKGERYGH